MNGVVLSNTPKSIVPALHPPHPGSISSQNFSVARDHLIYSQTWQGHPLL